MFKDYKLLLILAFPILYCVPIENPPLICLETPMNGNPNPISDSILLSFIKPTELTPNPIDQGLFGVWVYEKVIAKINKV